MRKRERGFRTKGGSPLKKIDPLGGGGGRQNYELTGKQFGEERGAGRGKKLATSLYQMVWRKKSTGLYQGENLNRRNMQPKELQSLKVRTGK